MLRLTSMKALQSRGVRQSPPVPGSKRAIPEASIRRQSRMSKSWGCENHGADLRIGIPDRDLYFSTVTLTKK
jgi:hypothetical protein